MIPAIASPAGYAVSIMEIVSVLIVPTAVVNAVLILSIKLFPLSYFLIYMNKAKGFKHTVSS